MKKKHFQENRRSGEFSKRIVSTIWQEVPSAENDYLTQEAYCHGYNLLELMDKRSFEDVLLLLLQGELPSPERKELLRNLMIGLINPGPRHPATRAAIIAGVGKSDPKHILPIALSLMGGDHLGAGEVAKSMEFLRYQLKKDPRQVAQALLQESQRAEQGEDWLPAAGFGSCFGGRDPMAQAIASRLLALPGAGKALHWGELFAEELATQQMGWRIPGVAAAAFLDLNISGLQSWIGAGLFQLLSAPGLLAHGLEFHMQPLTAYPFPSDDQYVIECDAKP
ncbi:MAG: citrate synthase [Magnetococcales bacterium]|nr:citrate synthase [Magnetococcales bacterium]